MKNEHEQVKLNNVLKSINIDSQIKLDVSEFTCKKCFKKITNLDEFLTHAFEIHNFKFRRNLQDRIFTYKLSDSDMECLLCGENFRFFGPLMMHTHKKHKVLNPFLCEMCGQGFVTKLNLDNHLKWRHSQSYSCTKCKENFHSLYKLKLHLKKIHSTTHFKCPRCPLIFPSRYLKKRHLVDEHDVKSLQFACDECSKIFTQKSILLNHKLKVHLKQKTVMCTICGHKCFDSYALRRHLVVHSEDRPFECRYCKKSFRRRKTLLVHERIHTNDRRFVCKECNKAFLQGTSLKLHVKSHHSIVK